MRSAPVHAPQGRDRRTHEARQIRAIGVRDEVLPKRQERWFLQPGDDAGPEGLGGAMQIRRLGGVFLDREIRNAG